MEAAPQPAHQRLGSADIIPVAKQQLALVNQQLFQKLHFADAYIQGFRRQPLHNRGPQLLKRC